MDHSIKHLPHKHEGLNSDSQHTHLKRMAVVVCTCNLSRERNERWNPRSTWAILASVTESHAS